MLLLSGMLLINKILGVVIMKLPNGYGSVTRLAGSRRRPWAVRKTINGKQIELKLRKQTQQQPKPRLLK